jgi:hypothetical protein
MERVPTDVDVHVLPTGAGESMRFTDPSQFRYRDVSKVGERIADAYEASRDYLADHVLPASAAAGTRDGADLTADGPRERRP